MPLKLKPLKKENEEIELEGKKLIVPGRVPMELMVEFFDLKDMDEKNYTKNELVESIQLIKRILYLENDEKKVDDFFKDLVPEHVNEVIIFVSNYILEGIKGKKKDSKAE